MIDGELRVAGGLDDELAELERKIKANKLGGNV